MKPELPPYYTGEACITNHLVARVSCGMHRLGQPCGNETSMGLLYQIDDQQVGLLPVCAACMEETTAVLPPIIRALP